MSQQNARQAVKNEKTVGLGIANLRSHRRYVGSGADCEHSARRVVGRAFVGTPYRTD